LFVQKDNFFPLQHLIFGAEAGLSEIIGPDIVFMPPQAFLE